MVDFLICFRGVMNKNSVFTQLDDIIFYSCFMLHVWQLHVASLKTFFVKLYVQSSLLNAVGINSLGRKLLVL